MKEIITEAGDMDFPSRVFYKLIMKKPSLFKYGFHFIKNYIEGYL